MIPTIINLTPYEAVFIDVDNREVGRLPPPPKGSDVHAGYTPASRCEIGPLGISIARMVRGPVVNLPAPRDGVFYLVDPVLLEHPDVRTRRDVVSGMDKIYRHVQDHDLDTVTYHALKGPGLFEG